MRIVITGGPGTGKTSLIKELESKGHLCFHENARLYMKQGIHPMRNKEKPFYLEMLKLRIQQFKEGKEHLSFYDRGIADSAGFFNYHKKEIPEDLQRAIDFYRYDHVFFLPAWEEIYSNDEIRQESFEDAKSIGNQLFEAYKTNAYQPFVVPNDGIQARIDFVLDKLDY